MEILGDIREVGLEEMRQLFLGPSNGFGREGIYWLSAEINF